MKNKRNILFAALLAFGMSAVAQTTISFESEDYKKLGVYDQWSESPFRLNRLEGNVAVVDNPDTAVDEVLGAAPNSSAKVLAFQRSRHGGNAFGARIDLKEPIRVTKQLQYIHVMAYLKDKPVDSRMMVIGLGKRVEDSWAWQTGEDEQFWAMTTANVKPKEGWQDIVVKFKGFSYSKAENENSGIDIYSLVIVPDLRSPHGDKNDWVAYFDEIVVDDNPEKRFSTDKYAIDFAPDAVTTRNDRVLNSIGLTANGVAETATVNKKYVYNDLLVSNVFSATAGQQVQPTFNYSGSWMSAYVYVDWGNDGVFKYDVNDNGTPADGSDVVSYNAAQVNGTWRKSDGTTTANGNTIGGGVPAFTVPTGTQEGFYRMRYKVDWDNLNPAGSATIISDGGSVVDVLLDVHGENVIVNASQLNGDIVLAEDLTPLQNYQTKYNESLKVKIIPESGFVQYGFQLKYGYNVNATEQFDENGNPNWVLVNITDKEISADGTYTIPAKYIRGGNVSIVGDMQQEQFYTVDVVGAPDGKGGVTYIGKEYTHGTTISASQYFSADDVTALEIEDYISTVTFDRATGVLTVTYEPILPYRTVTSLSELRNDMAYHIKAKTGEGYLAWNSTVTDTYLSLRGVTAWSWNQLPSNSAIANIYKEEVSPFDKTVVWQILKEGDSYYLYQPEKKYYVTRENRDYKFTVNKTPLDKIRDNGDGTFSFHAGGDYSESSKFFACICTNEPSISVRNWTWDDHGSMMEIIENPNINVVDIFTSIDEITFVDEWVAPTGIYNLQGQKLERLPDEGIVIVNGKKRLIRKSHR